MYHSGFFSKLTVALLSVEMKTFKKQSWLEFHGITTNCSSNLTLQSLRQTIEHSEWAAAAAKVMEVK